jgi:hypothetical protein
MAIGSDLGGRLGVCQADPCDRVAVFSQQINRNVDYIAIREFDIGIT